MIRRLAWPARLGSWRRWAIALGVVVLVRAALPSALRPLLESRASQAINARVDIGDVDLALYRAGVALEDVAVRPAGWTPETDTGDPPLVAGKRFATAVRWLPLFRKTIQLRELVLESPRVAVDRLQDGGFNVPAAGVGQGRARAPEQATSPAGEQTSSWAFAIDRIVLRDGGVRFRDLMLARAEPIELSLGTIEVEQIALTPAVYGEPARVHLAARVDDGRFALDARLMPREDGGFALASHLKARRLPLRRTRVYVPKVGWSDLQGEFGGALDYTLETGGRNEVRGQVTVDGLTVHTPILEGPALVWKRLAVQVDPIDLAGQRADLRLVDLSGMWLVARARGGVVFPFIEELLTGEPAGDEPAPGAEPEREGEPQAATKPDTEPTPAAREAPGSDATGVPQPAPGMQPAPVAQPAASAPAEAKPWRWSVRLLRVYESLLHVISPDASFDTGVDLTVQGLHAEEGEAAPLALVLRVGDGSLAADGKLRVQPLGFDGRVKASQLPLPDIVATVGAFPPGVVQSARLEADLGVAAGSLAPKPGDARVEGMLAFDEPLLVGAGGPTSEFGAKRVEFGMKELVVPGALAEQSPPTAADARLTGGTVALRDMRVARTQPTPIDVRAATLDAGIEELTAPGVGPPPPDGGALRVRGKMAVADLLVGDAGGSDLDLAIRKVNVGVGEFVLPGILAADPATITAPMRLARGTVALVEPRGAGDGPKALDARARGVNLTVGELLVPGALGGVPGDVEVRAARLGVAEPRMLDPRAGRLDVRARSIDVGVDDLVAPGAGAAPTTGPRLRGGRLALAEPSVGGADPKEFAVGAHAITVSIEEVAVAGPTPPGPTRVRLREVRLAAPRVQLTRTAEGLRLPPFGGGSAAPAAGPTAATTTTPSAAAARPEPGAAATAQAPATTAAPQAAVGAEPPPAAPAAGPGARSPAVPAAASGASATGQPVDLALGSFRLTDGRVGVTDRTVKPPYNGGLMLLNVELANLRWPALAASRLRVEATSARTGKILITGVLSPGGGKLEVTSREIPLKQFNPYATSLSPYSIRRGSLSVVTKATFAQGRYDSTSKLTLHGFDLGSRKGESLFKEQFGIPLSMALALLRDLQGNIVLDIPVEGDEQGMRIGYFTIVASALRRALVGALASPLKLVGAVFSGDKVQAAPAPITFRTGRDTLTDDGGKQVGQLAKFLSERPAMGVALQTAPTTADARWLHEHDLLEELGAPQGVFGTLRNLPGRGARDHIRDALAARAEEKPGELDADDAKTLEEWLAERPAPTSERVRDLAAARLAAVERALREKHRIGAERIVRRDPPVEPTEDAPPTVEIELGSVADLTAPPAEGGEEATP